MTSPNRDDTESAPTPDCPAIELRFPSQSEYLSLVRQVADWFASRCLFPERDRARIVLTVVEATTNIIRHAYRGDPDQTIRLTLRRMDDGLELEFLDDGSADTRGEFVGRDPESLEPGGLGVRMMKCCMDEFRYEVRPEGGARLVLRKRLRGGDSPDEPDEDSTGSEETDSCP